MYKIANGSVAVTQKDNFKPHLRQLRHIHFLSFITPLCRARIFLFSLVRYLTGTGSHVKRGQYLVEVNYGQNAGKKVSHIQFNILILYYFSSRMTTFFLPFLFINRILHAKKIVIKETHRQRKSHKTDTVWTYSNTVRNISNRIIVINPADLKVVCFCDGSKCLKELSIGCICHVCNKLIYNQRFLSNFKSFLSHQLQFVMIQKLL